MVVKCILYTPTPVLNMRMLKLDDTPSYNNTRMVLYILACCLTLVCLETVVFEREQACVTVCEERVKACGLFWAGGWGQRGMCLRESDNLDPVREKKKKKPKSLSAVTAGTFPN